MSSLTAYTCARPGCTIAVRALQPIEYCSADCRDRAKRQAPEPPRLRTAKAAILTVVADRCKVTVAAMKRKGRAPALVRARALAMVAMREAGYSYPEAGKALLMHHTTVMHHTRGKEAELLGEARTVLYLAEAPAPERVEYVFGLEARG